MPHELREEESRTLEARASAPAVDAPRASRAEDAARMLSSSSWRLAAYGVLTVVDASLALRPWLAACFTVLSLGLVPVWARMGLALLRVESAERARQDDVQVSRRAPYVVLALIGALIVASLAAKGWTTWLAFSSRDPNAFAVSYRVFGVLSLVLAALGLLGRPARLARFLALVAEHHARMLVVSFSLVSLLGAFLLTLPIALRKASDASFIDALFTSVSALCVTGLTVNTLSQTYSFFGQVVILVLVQMGGLGIMVLYGFFGVLAGRRMRVQRTAVMAQMLDISSLSSLRRALGGIVMVTFLFEALGTALLYYLFLGHPQIAEGPSPDSLLAGAGDTLWAAVFHSVSAFCNAGFSLFPQNLVPFASSLPVCAVIACLVVVGGLGFPVHFELLRMAFARLRGRRAPRLSLHSRVVLVTSAVLILFGGVIFALLESGNVFLHHGPGTQLLASFFHSAIVRTAGFNTLDVASLTVPTLLMMSALMFIGGSPGSTAGGIKTTTFAVLFATFRGELRNEARTNLGGSSLSTSTTRRALGVAFLSIASVFVLFFLLLLIEDHAPHQLGFEVVSALSTGGMSTGVTAELSGVGKLLIALGMLVGRVGPLTLALLLEKQTRSARMEYPEEHVGIG